MKVQNNFKKEFDNEPVDNEKYLKSKIKYYNGKIITKFRNNRIRKKGPQCNCLLVIFKTGKNYYPQVFLE